MYSAADPDVLAWAAERDYILLTHDVQTMIKHAYDRVRDGQPMPGVIEVSNDCQIGQAIEELLVVVGASDPSELANQVVYVPL
jgi:hypothetical protein